jgi:hypothetical protein
VASITARGAVTITDSSLDNLPLPQSSLDLAVSMFIRMTASARGRKNPWKIQKAL